MRVLRLLDRCEECAHVFRNPRPAPGLPDPRQGECSRPDAGAERLVGRRPPARTLRRRARALVPFDEPEAWLDIETGAARFPATARELHPYTAFDGLGTTGIERALAARRIDAGHRGTLTALAPRITGHYDAMSMFHHLERHPDPRAELRAARRVLRPGGHLVIEGAADSLFARLLGRTWAPHRDPRCLQIMPPAALADELERLGFRVLTVDHRAAHLPRDLSDSVAAVLVRLLPPRPPALAAAAREQSPTGLAHGRVDARPGPSSRPSGRWTCCSPRSSAGARSRTATGWSLQREGPD